MTKSRSNIYFASDFHLGMHPEADSREREKKVVEWLTHIENDVKELWLLGDLFDYWFEYKKVVPRGFVRFIGKLAVLADKGVKIHIFTGNHDVWYFDYLPREIGAVIHRDPITVRFNDKTFFLSHGDGLTKKDRGYLLIKTIFRSKFLQWCYARLHPNASASFAQWSSKKSRYGKEMVHPFKGESGEEQIIFARQKLQQDPKIDYFLFGHRHLPYNVELSPGKRVICLGDWISSFTYAVFDGVEVKLEYFKE